MGDYQQFIKFMSDIIESGTWARLCSSARTLYPVLLKFSDGYFKPAWPNTETLMQLTGFKTKKSIIEAKKDLIRNGLLQVMTGTGHKSSTYFFTFSYKGSRIIPLGDKNGYPGGIGTEGPEVPAGMLAGGSKVPPNNINITITNNQNHKQPDLNGKDKLSVETLIESYGAEIFSYAYQKAKERRLERNLPYLKTICKNKLEEMQGRLKNNHARGASQNLPTWENFLLWASNHLTVSTHQALRNLDIEIDGKIIFVQSEVNNNLQQIITKFFTYEVDPPILVIFSGKDQLKESRISGV
ncbi:MAG: helix-turn-helix domain-containing protein [Leptospira sp.]|nr:helix-turn-helix domain-containing protein [Leptospira sp.]